MDKNQPKPLRAWIRYAVIALAISMLGAIAFNVFDCHFGTNEQCMMSKGLFPLYLGGLFVFVWPITALIGSAVKESGEK